MNLELKTAKPHELRRASQRPGRIDRSMWINQLLARLDQAIRGVERMGSIDLDNLIQILQTVKPLLQNIYGRQPSVLADPSDPPDPPDIGDDAQRVFEPSMIAHKEAETGMSFFITKAQKAELRRRGYSEEQIREMKPEDAHRALGLIG